MRVYRGFKHIPAYSQGTVATIGNFDGLHRGHKALLSELRVQSEYYGLPRVVVLFEPQPTEFFLKADAPPRLMSFREKLLGLRELGVEFVHCLSFNPLLSQMDANAFASQILFAALHVKCLLIGSDFRFGKGRQGNVALLKSWAAATHASVHVFPEVRSNTERVSSSAIRAALLRDDLDAARGLLGRSYSLSGKVVRGQGMGRQFGIPTANIRLSNRRLPIQGVFSVRVQRGNGQWYHGVANLGFRPTLDGPRRCVLEVHLFECQACLYGETLHVVLMHKIRNEKKFPDLDALVHQIHQDVTYAKSFQKNYREFD